MKLHDNQDKRSLVGGSISRRGLLKSAATFAAVPSCFSNLRQRRRQVQFWRMSAPILQTVRGFTCLVFDLATGDLTQLKIRGGDSIPVLDRNPSEREVPIRRE